jgi:hypothetical protein
MLATVFRSSSATGSTKDLRTGINRVGQEIIHRRVDRKLPARPQNSISVCQSRRCALNVTPRCEHGTARHSQIAASSHSKPGRLTPEPERAKIVIDDRNIRPAEGAGPFGEAILTTPAPMIVGKLVGRRLPDVDEGVAR